MASRPILPACLVLALAGCTVGSDYKRPDVALPASYSSSANSAHVASSPTQAAPAPGWWRAFDDPGLNRAVERALAQNLDITAARARIVQSRAAASAASAAFLPKAELQASAGQDEQSLLDPFGVVARQVPGFERRYPLLSFGAAASWEIDLFGGLRRSREAARADLQASLDDLHAVQLSVAAETADAYLQLRAAQARSAVAQRRLAVEDQLVEMLTEARASGGSSERDLLQARALLDAVRADLAPIQAAETSQSVRLDILMGAAPGAYSAETAAPSELPRPPGLDALGAPADLLRRRPDVLAAERRLAGANARIGAAISDYYPKFSLSGLLGVESREPDLVFVGDAMQHQLTGAIRWRLFDFGRVDAEVAQARGRTAEALAAYRQTVFKATGEVETALADVVQARVQTQALSQQVAELERIHDQTEAARQQGGASLLAALTADRDLLAASDTLTVARAAELRADVAVSRATGGG